VRRFRPSRLSSSGASVRPAVADCGGSGRLVMLPRGHRVTWLDSLRIKPAELFLSPRNASGLNELQLIAAPLFREGQVPPCSPSPSLSTCCEETGRAPFSGRLGARHRFRGSPSGGKSVGSIRSSRRRSADVVAGPESNQRRLPCRSESSSPSGYPPADCGAYCERWATQAWISALASCLSVSVYFSCLTAYA
jgi:hypothetical protein